MLFGRICVQVNASQICVCRKVFISEYRRTANHSAEKKSKQIELAGHHKNIYFFNHNNIIVIEYYCSNNIVYARVFSNFEDVNYPRGTVNTGEQICDREKYCFRKRTKRNTKLYYNIDILCENDIKRA